MENYDDKIIIDDEVEFKYEADKKPIQAERVDVTTYSNQNVRPYSFFGTIFSKKYIALTLATMSIILTLFMKFLVICGATSRAFYGIWFFLCGGLSVSALILNIINFAKNKKFEFNVSSILTILSIVFLMLF